jgi:hypothetical protein
MNSPYYFGPPVLGDPVFSERSDNADFHKNYHKDIGLKFGTKTHCDALKAKMQSYLVSGNEGKYFDTSFAILTET